MRRITAGKNDKLKIATKFCDNFFSKSTNFDLISSDAEIHKIQTVINNRPMKVLNWLSPRELFDLIPFGLLVYCASNLLGRFTV